MRRQKVLQNLFIFLLFTNFGPIDICCIMSGRLYVGVANHHQFSLFSPPSQEKKNEKKLTRNRKRVRKRRIHSAIINDEVVKVLGDHVGSHLQDLTSSHVDIVSAIVQTIAVAGVHAVAAAAAPTKWNSCAH